MLALTQQFQDFDQLADRLGDVLESLVVAVTERELISESELPEVSKNVTL